MTVRVVGSHTEMPVRGGTEGVRAPVAGGGAVEGFGDADATGVAAGCFAVGEGAGALTGAEAGAAGRSFTTATVSAAAVTAGAGEDPETLSATTSLRCSVA